jgi:hypothetical protein
MSACNINITEDNPEVTALVQEVEIVVSPVEASDIMVTVQTIDVSATEEVVEVIVQDTLPTQVSLSGSVIGSAGPAGPIGPIGPIGPQGVSGTTTQGIAGEVISALRIVRSISATTVVYADSTLNFEDSRTLGMSTSGGIIGSTISVTFFGAIEDASFTFPINDPLFLTQNGLISNTQDPLSVYNSTIGYSLGVGAIFINLQEPIAL